MEVLCSLILLLFQFEFTKSGITWRTKKSSHVLSKTQDFKRLLSREKVTYVQDSGQLKVQPLMDAVSSQSTDAIHDTYNSLQLPIPIDIYQLTSFLEDMEFFNLSQTTAKHFWMDTMLKTGEMQWFTLYSQKDKKIQYSSIKASVKIPEYGEWREDCKKKVKTFKTTTTCHKYFVTYDLSMDHINLIKDKLKVKILSHRNFKQLQGKTKYIKGSHYTIIEPGNPNILELRFFNISNTLLLHLLFLLVWGYVMPESTLKHCLGIIAVGSLIKQLGIGIITTSIIVATLSGLRFLGDHCLCQCFVFFLGVFGVFFIVPQFGHRVFAG